MFFRAELGEIAPGTERGPLRNNSSFSGVSLRSARDGRFSHIEIHLLQAQSSRIGSAEKKARRPVKNTSTPNASASAGIQSR